VIIKECIIIVKVH